MNYIQHFMKSILYIVLFNFNYLHEKYFIYYSIYLFLLFCFNISFLRSNLFYFCRKLTTFILIWISYELIVKYISQSMTITYFKKIWNYWPSHKLELSSLIHGDGASHFDQVPTYYILCNPYARKQSIFSRGISII